jgi:hypothetical protein
MTCFFKNALPEPDFKYFSKLKVMYLLEKAKYEINLIGRRLAVVGTWPF